MIVCPICGKVARKKLVRDKDGNPICWDYKCIWNDCHATKPYGFETEAKEAKHERALLRVQHNEV